MKKIFIPLLIMILSFSLSVSQEIIENPEKPTSPDAGRVLQLQEELRITDEGGEFFFQSPRFIKVAPDESIYIYDRDQLIHLDKGGKFLHNLFKKGQGPGELNYISNFTITDKQFIVNGSNPGKLLYFDFEGNLQDEITLQGFHNRLSLLFIKDGIYYFIKSVFPRSEKASEVMDWPQVLCTMSGKMDAVTELSSFPIKTFVTGGAGISNLNLLTALINDRYLSVVHTKEYRIRIFDIQSNRVVKEVTRRYKSVRRPKGQRASAIIVGGKRYEAPGSEYLPDISQLYAFGDRIWVQTSTKDDKKGILFDVINIDGIYEDSFYLNIEGWLISIHKDCLFVRERDEDELVSIVKYRVIN